MFILSENVWFHFLKSLEKGCYFDKQLFFLICSCAKHHGTRTHSGSPTEIINFKINLPLIIRSEWVINTMSPGFGEDQLIVTLSYVSYSPEH